MTYPDAAAAREAAEALEKAIAERKQALDSAAAALSECESGMKRLEGMISQADELLKEADIVVTNPPFSLFREYIAQLMKYEKKFLIVGHQNAIHYKEIFPWIILVFLQIVPKNHKMP
jgi:predicted RNA methylase